MTDTRDPVEKAIDGCASLVTGVAIALVVEAFSDSDTRNKNLVTSKGPGVLVGRETRFMWGPGKQVRVPHRERLEHMHIVGATGSGKTTTLKNLIIQDFHAGNGVVIIDPKGDLAKPMMGHVPLERVDDCIVFDPTDREWPVAFNILEAVDSNQRSRAADEFVMAFKKIHTDNWGVQLDRVLRYAAITLMEVPNTTVLDVEDLLFDENYRQRVLAKVTRPRLLTFWNDRYPQMIRGGNLNRVTTPILNRIDPMLMYPEVERIVGQAVGSIDLRQVIEEKKILFINIPESELGEGLSKFLGAIIISKLQMAGMSGISSAASRPPIFLYIDEFQNFLTSSFEKIVVEARSFGMGLIVANQYIEQLQTKLQKALNSNVAVRLQCKVRNDRQRHWLFYQQPQKMENADAGFWLVPNSPIGPGDPKIAQMVRQRSRRRYAMPRATVDRALRRRRPVAIQQPAPTTTRSPNQQLAKSWSSQNFYKN